MLPRAAARWQHHKLLANTTACAVQASPADVQAAEAASAAAAAQAARADSLARALRKAEQTNDQLRRLKVIPLRIRGH